MYFQYPLIQYIKSSKKLRELEEKKRKGVQELSSWEWGLGDKAPGEILSGKDTGSGRCSGCSGGGTPVRNSGGESPRWGSEGQSPPVRGSRGTVSW